MKLVTTRLFLLAATLLLVSFAAVAQPTDNPFRTKYPGTYSPHWTDSIAWTNTVNIQNYQSRVFRDTVAGGLLKNAWDSAYVSARRAAAALPGGGVVFFPKLPQQRDDSQDSSYYFKGNLELVSNVVIRGENLPAGHEDAKSVQFYAPSYLEFPLYKFVNLPNSRAFKFIRNASPDIQRSGVVNLDINRAGVYIMPTFRSATSSLGTTQVASSIVKNILILGTRTNNVALPDPAVPFNPSINQRWSWRFAANILIYSSKGNVIINNNRLNDADTTAFASPAIHSNRNIVIENVDQSGYVAPNAPGNPERPALSGEAVFDYTAHYGIALNRIKLPFGSFSPFGFLTGNKPVDEPDLFVTGHEIADNWMFKTMRVGIHAGGQSLLVARNVIRDNPVKQFSLSPSGTAWNRNGVATYENRGIDVSGGFGAVVIDNDIQVYRGRFNPAVFATPTWSADGEGFYNQTASGGSVQRDHVFRNNIVRTSMDGLEATINAGQEKGYNGIGNTNEIVNVTIENNNSGGMPIICNALSAGTIGTLSGVTVASNTFARGIVAKGNCGGQPNFIVDNSALGLVPASLPQVQNNLQFTCGAAFLNRNGSSTNSNAGLTPTTCVQVSPQCTAPCLTNYPKLALDPSTKVYQEVLVSTGTSFITPTWIAKPNGNCSILQLDVLIDGVRQSTPLVNVDSVYSLNYQVPSTPGLVTFQADLVPDPAVAAPARFVLTSPVITYRFVQAPTSVNRVIDASLGTVTVFPNPAAGQLTLKLDEKWLASASTVRIVDNTGREVLRQSVSGVESNLAVSHLARGFYTVEVINATGRVQTRVSLQ